ncbi:hypothetical protein IV203_009681 [Nitzschia inconspicua]|uniref:Uncharacterized protein n=1 Tax=Nitzschia inconspicua TaxID=303405 RepID=A0A9K3PKP6_9STRA|nr:hypothetical protein IV203_009681 [Nitzschia inconspicua]
MFKCVVTEKSGKPKTQSNRPDRTYYIVLHTHPQSRRTSSNNRSRKNGRFLLLPFTTTTTTWQCFVIWKSN